MRGRAPNAAFFRQNDRGEAKAFSQIFRHARSSGKLDLSSKQLTSVPEQVFQLHENLEEGEKFWEINPLSKLDLSHNLISELPRDRFDRLNPDLAYLKLRDNKLKELPEDLFCCILLRQLDLGSNQLKELPHALGNLAELRELFLCDNILETLPDTLSRCGNLQVIDLQRNRLSVVPAESLMRLSLLQSLNMARNVLTELPASVSTLVSLECLDVSANKLSSIPDLTLLRQLTFLDASENKLAVLPVLPDRGKLDRLYLRENCISTLSIPALATVASTLTELLLQGNSLTSCSDDIAVLSKLKILDISNNDMGTLPHTLGYMAALSKLLVEGNPIRVIRRSLLSSPQAEDLKAYLRTRGPPPAAYNGGDVSGAAASTEGGSTSSTSSRSTAAASSTAGQPQSKAGRDTSYNVAAAGGGGNNDQLHQQLEWRIRDCTGGILELAGMNMSNGDFGMTAFTLIERSHVFGSLTSLNLSSNKLTTIPLELAELQSLRQLRLSNNMLGSEYPPNDREKTFQTPPFLTLLDISGNKLTARDFSAILESFSSLYELVVSSNNIDTIPRSILLHRKLRVLVMANNRIKGFNGFDFSGLKDLEVMDFTNNQLENLDFSLPLPQKVNTLLLSNNNIRDLPLELATLPLLRTLTLVGNPIKNIRPSVIAQGADAILSVLRIRLPQQQQQSPHQAPEQQQSEGRGGGRGMAAANNRSPRFDDDDISSARNNGGSSGGGRVPVRAGGVTQENVPRNVPPPHTSKQAGGGGGAGAGSADVGYLKAEAHHAAMNLYTNRGQSRGGGVGREQERAPPPPPRDISPRDMSGEITGRSVTGVAATSSLLSVGRQGTTGSRIPSASGASFPPPSSALHSSRNQYTMGTATPPSSGLALSTRGRGAEIACQRLGSGKATSSAGTIQSLTAELAALEDELQNCTSSFRKIEVRKAVAVKRASILRLQHP